MILPLNIGQCGRVGVKQRLCQRVIFVIKIRERLTALL